MSSLKMEDWYKKEDWYLTLENNGRYIFDLIVKYHEYFRARDKRYRRIVRILKVLILLLAMSSTIVLGLKNVIQIDIQLIVGLFLSSFITFVTAISSYFNFEEYWIRNIKIHIELNIIRDNFVFEAKSLKLDENRIEDYRKKLEEIQNKNIHYWEKAVKN